MTWSIRHTGIFFLIFILAVVLRTLWLEDRPFHVDEAVNGIITSNLVFDGDYRYDPAAYHGPSLYYLSALICRYANIADAAHMSEAILRLLPAVIGAFLVLLMLPLRRSLPPEAVLLGAFMLAVSPMLVFYSRYFIHEMLLVFFATGFFVCAFVFMQQPRDLLAILTGLFAGMAICTKETWLIFLLPALAALLFVCHQKNLQPPVKKTHFVLMAGALILPVLLFYSSFFTDLAGLKQIVCFPGHYIERAGGEGIHRHSFGYYFSLLFLSVDDGLVFIPETAILLMTIYALWRRRGQKYAPIALAGGLFAGLTILILSVIPYKTPWNAAGVIPPMIVFLSGIFPVSGKAFRPVPDSIVLITGGLMLCAQTWMINFMVPAEASNPFTYAQSGRDVVLINEKLEQLHTRLPAGKEVEIMVIAPDHAYWPLPWYLRDWEQASWWDHVPGDFNRADILIISYALEPKILERMYEDLPISERTLYVHVFDRPMELYPGNAVSGLIKLPLWEQTGGTR